MEPGVVVHGLNHRHDAGVSVVAFAWGILAKSESIEYPWMSAALVLFVVLIWVIWTSVVVLTWVMTSVVTRWGQRPRRPRGARGRV
jgi:hypothetical protein